MTPCRVHRVFWPILTGLLAALLFHTGLPQLQASPDLQTTATLRVDPVTRIVVPAQSFTVTIRIDGVQSLGGYEFELGYDRTVVQVVTITVGNFLSIPDRETIPLGPIIDNAIGRAIFGAVSYGAGAGGSGSNGLLATIQLIAQSTGSTVLSLANVQLVSTNAIRIPSQTQSGTVTILAGVGAISGTVTLQGRGQCDAIQIVRDAEPPLSQPCKFTLLGIPAGVHRVSLFHTSFLSTTRANITVNPGQTTTLPPVTLLAGDVNADGIVDIFDLVAIGIAYESSPVSNPRADLNGDGAVNIIDLTLLGINYQKRAPTPW